MDMYTDLHLAAGATESQVTRRHAAQAAPGLAITAAPHDG